MEKIRMAKIFFGFSFGEFGNIKLAEIALHCYREYGIPLALQWEIADIVEKKAKRAVIARADPDPGKYLSAMGALNKLARTCPPYQCREVVVGCHPDMHLRSIRMVEKKGYKNIATLDVKNVPYGPPTKWPWHEKRSGSFFFNLVSAVASRGRLPFMLREVATNLHHRKNCLI